MNRINFQKKIVACVVIMCTMVAILMAFPAMASEYKDEIIYTNDIENAAKLYASHTAPVKAGYVFGGWFKDDKGTSQVLENEDVTNIALYAKFVPAYVLSVKAQNHQAIVNGADSGAIRLISGVDHSGHYKKVGFDVYFANDEEQYGYAEGDKVYRKIIINKEGDSKEHLPQDVFGSQANYFNIIEIKNVARKNYSRIMYTRPYWVTHDGTKVYGLAKYVSIQDGLDGIVSIPVNLYTAEKIAAGFVKLTYPETLTYVGYQDNSINRMFNEFEINVDKESRTIACAGNVADVSSGNQSASKDLYVSLRFRIADNADKDVEVGKTRFKFDITDTEFCNWEEELLDFSEYVWDIQY